MDYQVQRIDSAPVQPTRPRQKKPQDDGKQFEREMEQAEPEAPPPPAQQEDTPVAPHLDDEAGGRLDLTA